jgi:hypothetical protein
VDDVRPKLVEIANVPVDRIGPKGVITPEQMSCACAKRQTRWASAFLLAAALAALVTATYFVPQLASCRDEVANTGNQALARACGPVETNDIVAVGLWLFVILLLLLPDLSEFGIAGLLTVKRKVAEVEKRQESLERTMAISLAANQQLTVTQLFYPPSLAPDGSEASPARREAEDKTERLGKAASAGVGADADTTRQLMELRRVSEERAVLESRLIAAWERISSYLFPVPDRSGRMTAEQQAQFDDLTSSGIEVVRDWREIYRREIDIARAARNTVVHQPQNLSDAEVREALGVAMAVLAGLDDLMKRPE